MNDELWKSGARIRPRLTLRQKEILAALADGLNSEQIAARLVLSPRTVYQHISRLKRLFSASTRAQLLCRAESVKILEGKP